MDMKMSKYAHWEALPSQHNTLFRCGRGIRVRWYGPLKHNCIRGTFGPLLLLLRSLLLQYSLAMSHSGLASWIPKQLLI